MKSLVLFFVIVCFVSGCSKKETEPEWADKWVGTWVAPAMTMSGGSDTFVHTLNITKEGAETILIQYRVSRRGSVNYEYTINNITAQKTVDPFVFNIPKTKRLFYVNGQVGGEFDIAGSGILDNNSISVTLEWFGLLPFQRFAVKKQ
ncbi:hypothetical protein P1X15_10715 [Runella sp. MFBS21]|uniref:hypothetical protein n=1 Tax=Runella sp. MFBS21 TaxID=3034018 RepID=UPI0023F687BA|nr:hypothetical protein [Runella sp. MFBS21]MDF7818071.1 hypothetical protein [Runella sp. MFBS21]